MCRGKPSNRHRIEQWQHDLGKLVGLEESIKQRRAGYQGVGL